MEPFRRCRSCGDRFPEDSENDCPECVSDRKWKELQSFRSGLSQLLEKFPTAALLVECPTLRNRTASWTESSSQLLAGLDDFFHPSDSCFS